MINVTRYSGLNRLGTLSNKLKSVGLDPVYKSNPATPNHSQHNKTVALVLFTEGRIDSNVGQDKRFIFPINPEEFIVSRQERVQVTQTLGEPFIDEFGKGIPTLNIRGTTGWRVRPGVQNIDGHEAFRRLHRNFINKYFELRLEKQEANMDPDDIMLVIINSVDDLVYKVVPMDFRLLRNKSKPLLYQYDISFRIIEDLGEILHIQMPGLTNKIKSRNWLNALTDRVKPLVDKIVVWSSPICRVVGDYLDQSVQVLANAKSGVADIANFLYGVTSVVELTLRSMQDTQKFVNELPLEAIVELNELTSVIGEFKCYLANGVQESWLPDFSGIHGISDCASTHGIKAGSMADSPKNTVEWVTQLKEASRQGGVTAMIGIQHNEDYLPNVFAQPQAPVLVDSTLDSKMTVLRGIDQNPAAAGSLDGAYSAIIDTLESIHFDSSLIPEDTLNDNLVKIMRYKKIEVKEGQTLQDIAFQEYGDVSRWTEIAAANDIVIESAAAIMAPLTHFSIPGSLYAGSSILALDINVPTDYAVPNCTLELKDALGRQQRMQVKTVENNLITFWETFSQNLQGPVSVVRYINLASFGVYDGKTTLAAPCSPGLKRFYLADIKDVYPGYTLFISGETESRSYSVADVNYLEKYVNVREHSVGFKAGAEVKIYNTDTNLVHLVPGTTLKIPILSGDRANAVQNDEEVYGGDLTLNELGLLEAGSGDLKLSKGLDNLKQAIIHRVVSDYKSLLIHPEYGCGLLAVIGEKNTPATRTLAKATLVEALNREPRIDHIKQLHSVTIDDAIKFSVQVESVDNNTSTDLNFVIGGK